MVTYVAVLNYSTNCVYMYEFEGDKEYDEIEDFLYIEKDFSPDEIYIMCSNSKIDVVYENCD